MLEQTLAKYQNRAIEAAQVIEELIELAKELREADRRGEKLGLNDDELAFYDALETNDSTGLVHELERICDWVGVMDEGVMITELPMEIFKKGMK
jgi:type I site-specific restriction-modification system R (restriction) subunit